MLYLRFRVYEIENHFQLYLKKKLCQVIFKFFPEFIAKGKNLITEILNEITEIYRLRFNRCNQKRSHVESYKNMNLTKKTFIYKELR